MTTEGFVKLPRTMLEWGWLDDGNTVKVYLVLLLSANWKDAEWHGIKLKRGQLITSVNSLSQKCRLTVQQVRTALSHLASTNEITISKAAKFSLVTLNNYDFPENVSTENNNVPTTKQQVNNNVSTAEQQVVNNVLTTVEERKEEKEKQEREEAAAPSSPSSVNSSKSFNSAVTRAELADKYGEENVLLYESKYDSWAAKKSITDFSNMYGVIAKWLAEDGIAKPHSSFAMDDVMRKIIGRYKSD